MEYLEDLSIIVLLRELPLWDSIVLIVATLAYELPFRFGPLGIGKERRVKICTMNKYELKCMGPKSAFENWVSH